MRVPTDDDANYDDDTNNNNANNDNNNNINDINNSDIDDKSVDTLNNNDHNKDQQFIPKGIRSSLQEVPYWSTSNRLSYATVAARSTDGNSESNISTIVAIIAPRKTAMNQTLGLISAGPYT